MDELELLQSIYPVKPQEPEHVEEEMLVGQHPVIEHRHYSDEIRLLRFLKPVPGFSERLYLSPTRKHPYYEQYP